MKKIAFLIFGVLFLYLNFFLIRQRFFNDQSRFFNDFPSYYTGTFLFWHNQNPYDLKGAFDRKAKTFNLNFVYGAGYTYPPLITFLFYPLLAFPILQAARIFAGINLFLYAIFAGLTFKNFKSKSFLKLLILAIFLSTYLPAVDSANHGHVNILVLFGLYFYLKFYRREKLSSLFLMLASFIKVYPVILFFKELSQRKFKFLKFGAFWGLLICLILGITKGFYLIFYYFFKVLPGLNNSLDAYQTNQSLNGFISRILLKPNRTFLISQSTYNPIIVGLTLGIIIYLSYRTIKWRGENQILSLIWLGTAILLAGRNSFSNFTPAVLIGIYLIKNFNCLSKFWKILFSLSVLLSNFFWTYTWQFNRNYVLQDNLWSKLIFVSFASLGFFSLTIQILTLTTLEKKPSLSDM